MSFVVHGHKPVTGVTPPPPIPPTTSFEKLSFQPVGTPWYGVPLNTMDITYDPAVPNKEITLTEDSTVNINFTEHGDIGQIKVNYTFGTEVITFNGLNTFTNRTTPGFIIINLSNSEGSLTFS